MTDALLQKCKWIFDHQCPVCKHRKKTGNDCSIHSAILVPLFEKKQETMFAEQVAIKTFKENTCAAYEPKE